MNNKKLSRLLEPNLKLYFLCMVLFCCAAAVVSPLLALAEAAVMREPEYRPCENPERVPEMG